MQDLKVHIPITSLALDDRPREKLMNKGRTSLSDAELIAILLGSGSRNETAIQLSQRILNENHNNLNNLGQLSVNDLKKYKGIGEAKAVTVAAALELGRRRKESEVVQKPKINTSNDAFQVISETLADIPHEEFWVLMLNRGNQVVRKEFISRGGVAGTVVDPRLVFKSAVEHLASSLILVHNHPSGNLKPSKEDIILTGKLKGAGKLLDISVIDHLIIGENAYFSFADEGII
jgi:DNA repair protein RadC